MNRSRIVLAVFLSTIFASHALARQGSPEAPVEQITVADLKSKLEAGAPVLIIDVRGADYDKSQFKIKTAIRISPAELQSQLKSLRRDVEVVTYCACATDGGAIKAARALLADGFERVRVLKGGWNAWNEVNGQVEGK